MRRFWSGLILGLVVGGLALGGALIWPQIQNGTKIGSFRPTTSPTTGAATAENFAANVPAAQQVQLTLALSDDTGANQAVNPTDLTSIDITITQAEAILIKPTLTLPGTQLPRTEILNLSQPTIELFSLRGSGSIATLGTTGLAPGQYSGLRLTIGSAKGRRADGHIFDIRLPNNQAIVTIAHPFSWKNGDMIQLVVDLDSFASLSQQQTTYLFRPVIRHVLQNDTILQNATVS